MRYAAPLSISLVILAGCDKLADAQLQSGQPLMNSIYKKVSEDAEAQYGIAQRNGSAIDRCVAAGMVVAAHLQAQAEAEYSKWKAIERRECVDAGVPQ